MYVGVSSGGFDHSFIKVDFLEFLLLRKWSFAADEKYNSDFYGEKYFFAFHFSKLI